MCVVRVAMSCALQRHDGNSLRALLMDPTASTAILAQRLDARWPNDFRYDAYYSQQDTRAVFFAALTSGGPNGSGLTRAHVLASKAWDALQPPRLKAALTRALRSGVALSEPVATCAAVHLMDSAFGLQSSEDLLADLLDATPPAPAPANATTGTRAADERAAAPGTATIPSLWHELYETLDTAAARELKRFGVADDPHNAIYTTPYPWVARGFYGGNLSLVFSSVDEGSGLDAKFASHWGCAPRSSCAASPSTGRSVDPGLEAVRARGDADPAASAGRLGSRRLLAPAA